MAYCSNCGKELKENYKFCPKCGTAVVNSKSGDDSLYDDVVKYVVKSGKASISMLQKEFKLSYAKASSMINLLEENGVVGKANGNKGRKVLISEESKDKVDHENDIEDRFKAGIENIMDTPDTTSSYDDNDIKDNMFLSILSYLGLLVFIPYFVPTDSKFVKYHATQGMNLLIVWLIYTILDGLLGLIKVSKVVVDFGSMVGTKLVTPIWISFPMGILRILLIIISVIGIVYVCQGKAKELPLVGKIKIVK